MTQNRHAPLASPLPATGEIVFNGVDGSTGGYLTAPMEVARIAGMARGEELAAAELGDLQRKARRAQEMNYATIEGVDPNDLAQAGWAVVFPAVEPGSEAARQQTAILEALAPLREHRRAQATRLREHGYREYTGERGYRRGETKQQYLARLGAGPGPVNPDKVPYYLLLVASPEEIPYRIQYQLDVQYAVGRIHFDSVDEYARYARSVVEAETGQVARARRAAFFGVATEGDRATELSHGYLVAPLARYIEETCGRGGWAVERYLAGEATRARLGALYRDAPALLFTASHGVGFPGGDGRQRAHQGALLCQDWGGPGSPVAREHYFAGEDIDPRADLRGMISTHFACYGMGTPARDDFARRAFGRAEARAIAPRDFVARLPQRMLAHPGGGALAAIGHIDRAWASSFLWIDAQGERQTQAHVEVFESALAGMMAGKRVGHALEHFNLRYAELASDLSARVEAMQRYGEEYEDRELAQLWIFQNDARNYAVVGDPAARIRGPGEEARARGDDSAWVADLRQAGSAQAAAGPDAGPGVAGAAARESAAAEPSSYGWFSKDEPGILARFGSKVTETLGSAIADAAALEVKTYVSSDMQRVAAGSGDLAQGGARLRAYTRCALDGDTEVCVPVGADGQVDQTLWALHVEMVKQAQQHRSALVETVLSLIRPSLKD